MDEELLAQYKRGVQRLLTDEDDINLWTAAFETIVPEIELLKPTNYKKSEIYIEIGACAHWYRPHQTRWKANGGFAWPSGYGGGHSLGWKGLPEYEWSRLLRWDDTESKWELFGPILRGKKKLVCRVSIPTRTALHDQAAVHVLWSPGTPLNPNKQLTLFYGFRKLEGQWQCVASRGFPELEESELVEQLN